MQLPPVHEKRLIIGHNHKKRRRKKSYNSLDLTCSSNLTSEECFCGVRGKRLAYSYSHRDSRRDSIDSSDFSRSLSSSPPSTAKACSTGNSSGKFLWCKEDTEYYSHLADMHRDFNQNHPNSRSAPSLLDSIILLADYDEEHFRMRLPRAKCIRASYFIPQSDLVSIDSDSSATDSGNCDSENGESSHLEPEQPPPPSNGHDLSAEHIAVAREILIDHFHEWHRCDHVFQIMAYHPEYLRVFLNFHNLLLQGPGPIGVSERHYLAIMAASRHRCVYLVQLHAQEFILAGGDPDWLRGISHASAKLQKLAPLCQLLAHRPWEVTSKCLKKLLSGPDSFSQSELVHALALLGHFIAFSGFVAGTGVAPEMDFSGGYAYGRNSGDSQSNGLCPPGSPTPSSPGIRAGDQVLDLMKHMEDIENKCAIGLSEDLLLERFQHLEEENADIAASVTPTINDDHLAEMLNFVHEPQFGYVDFVKAKAAGKWHSFRAQDYDWEEQGRCMADRFLPDLGSTLDARFQTSFTLTYGTLGMNRGVNTSPYRRAVWYYVHSIYGLRHDDYDYAVINRLLSMELKTYCKMVACFPERVTHEDYRKAMPYLKHSEKVHVNLVILDARLQATLLYGLRALNNHLNSTDCDF